MNTQTPLRDLMTTDLTVIKLDTPFNKIKSIDVLKLFLCLSMKYTIGEHGLMVLSYPRLSYIVLGCLIWNQCA